MFRRLLIIAITLTSASIGCDGTEETLIAGTLTATFEGMEHRLDTGNDGSTYVSSSDERWSVSCWRYDGDLTMTLGERSDAGTSSADVFIEAQDRSGTFDSKWYFRFEGTLFPEITCATTVYQEQSDPFRGYIALADCDLGQHTVNKGSAEESPMRIDRGLFHLRCQ